MFDWDRLSKNDCLGEVKLELGQVDFSTILTESRHLEPYSGKPKAMPHQGGSIHQRPDSKAKESGSSSDEEKKSKNPPKGPPLIHHRISYDRNYQSLKVTVIECKVWYNKKLKSLTYSLGFEEG